MTNAGPLYEAIRARLNLDDDFAQLRKRIHDLAVKTHDHAEDKPASEHHHDEIDKRLKAIEGTLGGLERRSGSDALAGIAERLDDHDERFIGLVQRVDELAKSKPSPKPRAKPSGTKAKATTGKA